MFRLGRISPKISAPSLVMFSVGCCVGLARGGRSRPRPGPSLSLFRRPIRRPKTAGKILPTRSASVASHQILPPPASADLRLFFVSIDKRWSPKVAAPPISQFFDGCPFGAQNKWKESGENEPRPLAPEQDSWGGAAS